MTVIEEKRVDRYTDDNDTDRSKPVDATQALLDGLGGVPGMLYTALPVAAFAASTSFASLPVAIGIALAIALGLTMLRVWRGERMSIALGGVIGVAVAGGIALWTGSAGGFFLLGIWASLAGTVLLLLSLLVRRPLTGIIWNALHGNGYAWRDDRPTLRAHDIATLAGTTVFAARFVVKHWLYDIDATGWLAFAKIAMGTPLTALVVVVVVWAFRRSTRRLGAA